MSRRNSVRWLTACPVAAMVAAAAMPLSAQTPAPVQNTPPAAKPPIILAEEALDQNRTKDAVKFAQQAVEQEPGGHAWFVLARAQQADGNLDAAIDAGHRAATFASVRASAYYNLACAYAARGNREDAFKALTGAKRAGFADRDLMAKDRDLAPLRGDARFVLPAERNFFTLKLKNGTDLPFSVDLPVNYDPAKAYPVLVAPGQGRKIEGSWGGLFWGEDTSQRGWIAVESPALLTEDPMGTNAELFDEIARRYKIEGDRFHLVGYGPSSAAAFAVAITFPQRVKSLWVLPGFPVGAKDDGLARLKGVKVSFIVGDRDPYWYQESQAAHRKLQSLGVDAYLEVVQGGGHLLQEMFGGEFAERLDNVR
jgi:predicted esterase